MDRTLVFDNETVNCNIGAGIIGMTSAMTLKNDFPNADVIVFAELFTPDTTGDGSAGLWGPYVLGETSDENILRWAGATHKWMESFWKSPLTHEVGISLVHTIRVTDDPKGYPKPFWYNVVYGATQLKPEDLERINKEYKANYSGGWHFLTYTCEPVKLLPWLMKKFQFQGGQIKRRKIQSLEELKQEKYDIVVNCSGLGARELVQDCLVTPVRGQVSRVDASWIFHSILEELEDGKYIIPNIESVILGGTRQKNDFYLSPRKEDSKFIHDGCARIIPGVKTSAIFKDWVGLRPGRTSVRLEAEIKKSHNSKDFVIIHNYGHGGAGVTLSWGCALEVVNILKNLKIQNLNSKL